MVDIVTLTPNPAVDLSTSVERLVPSRKLRCAAQKRDPGGGGINVARVVKRFGGDVEAVFPAGGFTGKLLKLLLDEENVPSRIVEAVAETREDFSVSENATGEQYRFVLPGLPLAEHEWRGMLDTLAATSPAPKIVIGSGSLPPGVPVDFYAQAAAVAKQLGAKFFLDTSGKPLAAALAQGVTLIKPNLREMQELAGRPLGCEKEWVDAARAHIATGQVEELIDQLRAEFSVVIVTHSMQQAARVSQKTAFFHLGNLVEYGSTDDIITNPRDPRTESYISGRIG